jgi:TPR repeat protein
MQMSRVIWILQLSLVWVAAAQQAPPNPTPTNTLRSTPGFFVLEPESVTRQTNESAIDTAETIEKTRAKAEKGDPAAQVQLGLLYWLGQGVTTNYAEAAKWFRMAAEQGSFDGQMMLAGCYREGKGVPKDEVKASEWTEKALLDNPGAVEFFPLRAEQGDALCQFCLGRCYAIGQGVAQDFAEALKWHRKAAEQGLAESQVQIGGSYYGGQGVPQDFSQAVKWFEKAAQQGNAQGQAMLGICYIDGNGVPRNDIEAYKWLSLAIAREHEKLRRKAAGHALNIVETRMSRAEIVEAQRRAAEFVPRKEAWPTENFPPIGWILIRTYRCNSRFSKRQSARIRAQVRQRRNCIALRRSR